MCVERVQRLMMVFILSLSFYFFTVQSVLGPILLGFVIIMILVWAITNFCPSIWILKKFLPKCWEN